MLNHRTSCINLPVGVTPYVGSQFWVFLSTLHDIVIKEQKIRIPWKTRGYFIAFSIKIEINKELLDCWNLKLNDQKSRHCIDLMSISHIRTLTFELVLFIAGFSERRRGLGFRLENFIISLKWQFWSEYCTCTWYKFRK